MAIYMIGYDIHPKQGETYDKLIEAIKKVSAGNWWHCLDSTWLIKADYSAAQVRDALTPWMRSDDQLLVAKYDQVNRGAAWFGFNEECASWLRNNL